MFELCPDDRRRDGFAGVDDLLDARNTQGDIHGSDTSKMEGLESHLRAWFSDGLSSNRANSSACAKDISTNSAELGL